MTRKKYVPATEVHLRNNPEAGAKAASDDARPALVNDSFSVLSFRSVQEPNKTRSHWNFDENRNLGSRFGKLS